MKRYKIAVIVGSFRKDSFNRKLAGAVIMMLPSEFLFQYL